MVLLTRRQARVVGTVTDNRNALMTAAPPPEEWPVSAAFWQPNI